MNNIIFVVVILAAWIKIYYDIKKKRIQVKASFFWSALMFVMLILAIFPYSIDTIAGWLNVSYAPSLLFTFCILFLLLMNYRSIKRIDSLEEKIIKLEQEIAINKVQSHNEKIK